MGAQAILAEGQLWLPFVFEISFVHAL